PALYALSLHDALPISLLWNEPAAAHRLLDVLAQSVTAYLQAQLDAGAQALMLFDTWGGALSADHYREFSLRYMAQIASALKRGEDRKSTRLNSSHVKI